MATDSPVEFQRLHLGSWEDNRWRKEGADCFYLHPTKQVLPCRILRFEYKNGVLDHAYCNAMGVTGRFSGRMIQIEKLQRTASE